MPRPLDVVGTAEVAKILGVAKSSVPRGVRLGTIPEPDVRLACGSIWRRKTIERARRTPRSE